MEIMFIYITTKDRNQALEIGEKIVQERLVACVNIVDSITSIYHWKGSICKDQEALIIAKTNKNLLEKLIARVKELHSYEIPCIVALPIQAGYDPYLKWISDETVGELNS